MPEIAAFDHYEVLTRDDGSLYELGRGAMGVTYKAFDKSLRFPVCLKVINAACLKSEVAQKRFIREAKSAARLRHRNVASVFHLKTEGDTWFYAMEFIDGETLDAVVKREGTLAPRAALEITEQVARALNAATQYRLVHRDIKPANLMLVKEDDEIVAKVIDFGLAKTADDKDPNLSLGAFVGTPLYASPEQFEVQEIDVRSDIYSLGVTLWYMLAGQPPFDGSIPHVMSQHISKPPPFERFKTLPQPVAALLQKMLEKHPADRFQTPAELQRAIKEVLGKVAHAPAEVKTDEDLKELLDVAGKRTGETRFEPGVTIAKRYRIAEALGETNAGRVFRAEDSAQNRFVRLLVLHQEILNDPKVCAALEREVERLAQVTHPNLLGIFNFETIENASFLAMEWTDGFSLLDLLRARRELGADEVIALLKQAAGAVDYALKLGLTGLEFGLYQIMLHFDAPFEKDKLLHAPIGKWPAYTLKLHPLELARDLNSGWTWNGQTMVRGSAPASTDAADVKGRYIRSLATVAYELLGGKISPFVLDGAGMEVSRYTPLSALSEERNEVLKRALDPAESFESAGKFRNALARPIEMTPGPPRPTAPPPTCAIVRPGLARDASGREQEVSPGAWIPKGLVKFQATGETFRLPEKLDLLLGTVTEPGRVRSPFAELGSAPQRVPWNQWKEGERIMCGVTGKDFQLPMDLPLPEAVLTATAGEVFSPYDEERQTPLTVPANQWEPGGKLNCPASHLDFILPQSLPALDALADASRAGVLATPYAPQTTWVLRPEHWKPGSEVRCPKTRKPLRIPALVRNWAAQAKVVDPSNRMVTNPFSPGNHLQVPLASWYANATSFTPEGQTIVLPPDLPLLTGELEGQQPGRIRCPFTGQSISVTAEDWIAGKEIMSETGLAFLLPPRLPEWRGDVAPPVPPWHVKSPYAPGPVFPVPPTQWKDGEILKCPATGRSFRLPDNLPLVEGAIEADQVGWVISPFSSEAQEVSFDDWTPGKRLQCRKTRNIFVLPANLPKWPMDGKWIPGKPGFIRSPFASFPEVEMTAEQWKPGALVTCPETENRFRAPIHPAFPTLRMEQHAVSYALAEPDATFESAAAALRKLDPSASVAIVESVWARHHLLTREARWARVETGVADAPGIVRSPYGNRPKVKISPELWAQDGASLLCPETGRRFRVPADLPPLIARTIPANPGKIISPFHPKAFSISPDEWNSAQMIRCQYTNLPLQLPANLPPWTPTGKTRAAKLYIVSSPFGSHPDIPILRENWVEGARITCPETDREFTLPAARLIWEAAPYVKRICWAAGGIAVLIAVAILTMLTMQQKPEEHLKNGQVEVAPPKIEISTPFPTASLVRIVFPSLPEIAGHALPESAKVKIKTTNGEMRFPLQKAGTQTIARIPSGMDIQSAELQIPGWKTVKLTPKQSGEGTYEAAPIPKEALERNLAPLPLIVPNEGTDYDSIDALWLDHLANEPDVTRPVEPSFSVNVNQINHTLLPTGHYQLRLKGKGAVKDAEWEDNLDHTNEIDVSVSDEPPPGYLPKSFAGQYYGLLIASQYTDRDGAERAGGYFIQLTIKSKPFTVSAVVNPIGGLENGMIISRNLFVDELTELGSLQHWSLTNSKMLEFDAVLQKYDFHWSIAREGNSMTLYGVFKDINDLHESFAQHQARMAQMIADRFKDTGTVPPFVSANNGLSDPRKQKLQEYKIEYEDERRLEEEQKEAYAKEYPQMRVKGASRYVSLHSANKVVKLRKKDDGDWTLEEAEK